MNNGHIILIELLNSYGFLDEIKVSENTLIYKGVSIDLNDFDSNTFLEQNPKFKSDLPDMLPDTVFNIIKLHVTYNNMEIQQKEKKVLEYIDTTQLLKQFQIIKRKDINNKEQSYLHYIDDKNEHHVLVDVDYDDLLLAYRDVLQNDSLVKTSKAVFDILKAKTQEITLEDLEAIKEKNNEQTSMGINNAINVSQQGDGIDVLETPINELQNNIIIQDKTKLITWNEYVELIASTKELSPKDKDLINRYESFLFDIITYHD